MKEINLYLKKETKEYRRKSTLHLNNLIDNKWIIKHLKEDYYQWLNDLKQLMTNGLCRQVLKEIEEKKYKYELIKEELWKYRLIKAKAILKIIKVKMNRHPNEIILDNSSQNIALKFWFNQIFITLEELILEFRYNLNAHMDYKSKKIIEPIQKLIEYHLEYIYYLCIFSIKTNEIIPLIAYLSIVDKFLPYIPFLSKSNLLNIFQNIILLKVKLLIENCDFLSAIENIKIVFKLCFRELFLFLNVESQINIDSLNNINDKKKSQNKTIFGFCRIIKKIVLGYFLRGVTCEHLGYFDDSVHAYKMCRWFSNKFIFDYSKDLFKYFRNLEKKYIIYKDIFDDIYNQFIIKNKNVGSVNNKKFIRKKHIFNSYRNNRYNSSHLEINANKSKYKSSIRLRNSSIKSYTKKEKLEKLLKNIGKNLYKEEENRNNNIFKKFTKNSFVLSTVKMINNLLSDQFNHVLKKMEKVEITKPQDDINHLINWTIYFQRQKDFKNHLINQKENKKKGRYRNNSCINFQNVNDKNFYISTNEKGQPIKILKNIAITKNDLQNNRKMGKSQTVKNRITTLDNIFKYNPLLSSAKTNQNITNNNSKSSYKKILKFPLNKDVFSKSLLNKKNYLDSFYEKELNFQKKLLKLKGYDTEKVTNEYNQQQVIKSAEQDFKIIQCFAESKNTKKNLMNLIKNTNEFHALEIMFPDKKLRNRSNKIVDLKNLKNYMLINNITPSEVRYEPKDVKKYNEEKSKALNLECVKLEQLQNKYQTQRKILMSEGIRRKRIIDKNYY